MRMLQLARTLFPINRSLTGPGVRETIEVLRNENSELQVESVKSGDAAFDWTIPKEWIMRQAYVEHIDSGKRFAEFNKLNLHIVGYSEPVDKIMSLNELKEKIYTQPDQPDLVPYVTSYYKPSWGFCMSQNEKDNLPAGDYRVFIDSELVDGELNFAHARIVGRSKKEIFFSSYICHPSMANNEVSGPVLISTLLSHLKAEYPTPRYTYRFVLVPETIGSLAYLSRHLDDLKRNVVCGFNLSCVGDERAYSHIESRLGHTLADQALESAFVGLENATKFPFLYRQSDERQYCAPGIDLPLAGFCRTKYGDYPEYHTNADNFDVVTEEGLKGAFDVISTIIRAFECGLYPRTLVLGEPQLGKRGLYPTTSQKGSYDAITWRMDILAYADGNLNVFEISKLANIPLKNVLDEIHLLKAAGLITCLDEPD